jgi:citrate synthase
MDPFMRNDSFDAENAELLEELVAVSKTEYQIPNAEFDNYRVKRGLREPDGTGVMAGVTRVCNAHGYIIDEGVRTPVDGRLYYRGYRMSDLCENFVAEGRYGFTECCYLLFFGHLPTAVQLERFATLMDRYSRLPARFDEDILMKAPTPSIMNKLATGVLSLYAYDDNPDETSLSNMIRQSMQLVARLPVIAAHTYAVYRNVFGGHSLNLHNPKDGLPTAANFLRMLRSDKSFTEEEGLGAQVVQLPPVRVGESALKGEYRTPSRQSVSPATRTEAVLPQVGSLSAKSAWKEWNTPASPFFMS